MPPEYRLQAFVVMWAILFLLIVWIAVRVIRSLGRAARPPMPVKPTDSPDIWPQHRLPPNYEQKLL
jgi:hypothetical protein